MDNVIADHPFFVLGRLDERHLHQYFDTEDFIHPDGTPLNCKGVKRTIDAALICLARYSVVDIVTYRAKIGDQETVVEFNVCLDDTNGFTFSFAQRPDDEPLMAEQTLMELSDVVDKEIATIFENVKKLNGRPYMPVCDEFLMNAESHVMFHCSDLICGTTWMALDGLFGRCEFHGEQGKTAEYALGKHAMIVTLDYSF